MSRTWCWTGAAAIDGTGNGLRNAITGNGGANRLDGGGDADTLVGGAGDDTYVVDHAGDSVVEEAGQGTDTVLASVGTTLSAFVEQLVLTGIASIDGTGNSLDNILTGNCGPQPPRRRRRGRYPERRATATTPTSSTMPATW